MSSLEHGVNVHSITLTMVTANVYVILRIFASNIDMGLTLTCSLSDLRWVSNIKNQGFTSNAVLLIAFLHFLELACLKGKYT